MYRILDNGQVMTQHKTATYEQWLPIGNVEQIQTTETETMRIHQWTKFNLETGKWDIDKTNSSPIKVNDIEHVPSQGKVEVSRLEEIRDRINKLQMELDELRIQETEAIK